MKRTLFTLLALFTLAGIEPSASAEIVVPDVPQCKGVVLSQIFVDAVEASRKDPRQAFEKKRRQGVENVTAATVECASGMWQAMQTPAAKKARAAQRKRDHAWEEKEEAHEAALRKAMPSPRVSAPGLRAAREHAGEEYAEGPYTGPPNDHRPVRAVRTQPLRKAHPLPPPRRGEKDGETHPEPPRPNPPTEVGGPDGAIQNVEGRLVSAPTAGSLNFDGVGVGVGGFSPASNPPDVNGRVGATQYVQWNNSSFAIFDKATGALQYGPAAGNTLFQSLGGVCATHNDGDPSSATTSWPAAGCSPSSSSAAPRAAPRTSASPSR
jgi:hypothetical protein